VLACAPSACPRATSCAAPPVPGIGCRAVELGVRARRLPARRPPPRAASRGAQRRRCWPAVQGWQHLCGRSSAYDRGVTNTARAPPPPSDRGPTSARRTCSRACSTLEQGQLLALRCSRAGHPSGARWQPHVCRAAIRGAATEASHGPRARLQHGCRARGRGGCGLRLVSQPALLTPQDHCRVLRSAADPR